MSRHQKHMADMGMERRPNKYESKYEILREITKRLLIMALLLCMTVQTAFAAEGGNEKEYTYTVTLSAGNQGTFNGTGGVHVIGGSARYQAGMPSGLPD